MRFLKKSRNLKRTYSSFSELSKYFFDKESRFVLWSPMGRARVCTPGVPAFAETLRAGRRYGTQAWLSAAGINYLLEK